MQLTPEQTGEWFAEHLAELDATQTEFATLNQLTIADLSRYKQQKAHPSYANVERSAEGFGIDVIS